MRCSFIARFPTLDFERALRHDDVAFGWIESACIFRDDHEGHHAVENPRGGMSLFLNMSPGATPRLYAIEGGRA